MTDDSEVPLSATYVEWLSLIKYQLLLANEQVRQSAPLDVLAINTLQDAVEAIINLTLQLKGGSVSSRPDFLQSFDAAMDRLGNPDSLVAYRPALSAMNTSRVNFKHHGNVIGSSTLRRHVERATDFVEELSKTGLGLSLADVSLLAFVQNETARAQLVAAQQAADEGDWLHAMEGLRLGFETLVSDYTGRKVWSPGHSIYSTKPSFFPSVFDVRDMGKGHDKVVEWLESIDNWVKYLSLGLDMRQYAYFDAYTPSISFAIGGNHFTHWREGVEIDAQTFHRCMKFVIETALAFASDDFEFDAFEARNRAYRQREKSDGESQ